MRSSILFFLMLFGCTGGLSAQETEVVAQLNARIHSLEERLAQVEARQEAMEARPKKYKIRR